MQTFVLEHQDGILDEAMRRELAPLRKIGDEYRKMVVVQDGTHPSDIDGIEIVDAVDFLLHNAKL